jgi:alkaline phosphatase
MKSRKEKLITATGILVVVLIAGLIMPGFAANKNGKLTGKGKKVKNVIVMIADGGGFNQYLASDYYRYGAEGASMLGDFPTRLAMSTYSTGQSKGPADDAGVVYDPNNWSDPVKFQYGATDSAAAASALSTGVKTWDAAIGIAPNDAVLRHMTQDFEALGKATGVVTSVPFSHATPAGFIAHNSNRSNYAAIADEMIKTSATDVIMGCGSPFYNDDNQPVGTPNYGFIPQATWDGLVAGTLAVADANGDGVADPWTFIQTKPEFEALQIGVVPNRLIGIAQCYQTLQEMRVAADWAKPAYTSAPNAGVPNLVTMAKGALNILKKDNDGFFLMIEGGAVDWAGHFNQTGRLLEEMDDFHNTIEAVYAWVEENSNWGETLLIVTADHETGYLSGSPVESLLTPVLNNGIGVDPTMYNQINKLDLKYKGYYWHSNQLVPFYAKGAGAEIYKKLADQFDPVRGNYLDNTEISVAIRELLFK